MARLLGFLGCIVALSTVCRAFVPLPLQSGSGVASTGSRRQHTWRPAGNDKESGDGERTYIPFSGLQGTDTSKLKGAEKRDADWFARQAEREKNGELNPLEDPVFYIALFTLTPVFIFAWGVAACYIPIGCTPEY